MRTPTPHDALCKTIFEHPEHMAGELRCVLPAAVTAALDLTTLSLEPGSYIGPSGVEVRSDLLFSVHTSDGSEVLVYVLFEHQSSVDARMPFRMIRYMFGVWERWLVDHPGKDLPAILPVVLSHATGGWTAPTRFHEMFGPRLPQAMRAHLPEFEIIVDDLSEQTDEMLRGRAMSEMGRLGLFMLARAREADDLLGLLVGWAEQMKVVMNAPHGSEALGGVLRYALKVNDGITREDMVRELVPLLGEKIEEIIMTEGDRLEAKGREEGRVDGQRIALLGLLMFKFRDVPSAFRARIEAAKMPMLTLWWERTLTAERLDDVVTGS